MTSRTRLLVLVISTPVIAFAIIGGYLGQALARDETIRQLRIFEDVVSLVIDNYVEPVDVQKAMRGAMRGLADGLDSDSAFLTSDLVKVFEAGTSAGPADVGIELTRRYYLQIVAVRDGSPAAGGGLQSGDFIRAIDGRATRDMTAFEGARLLRGAPGSKVTLLVFRGNAADPHEITLTRARSTGPVVTSRMANASTGYVRVVEFTRDTGSRLKQAFDGLAKTGATRFVIDLRGSAIGDPDLGVDAARLFVRTGTLVVRETRGGRETVTAQPGDAALTAPVVLLVDQGTAGPGELFASALDGNNRAELIGERTLGRAARQQLVKLPDGSGMVVSFLRYLTPSNEAIHERGLIPDVPVEQPDVEFGIEPPPGDPTLDKALERLAERKAA
jgi:carboxyl-terminal processing protease